MSNSDTAVWLVLLMLGSTGFGFWQHSLGAGVAVFCFVPVFCFVMVYRQWTR